MGRPPIADEVIHHRAMELVDHGWSLSRAAEQLAVEYPDRLLAPPSKSTVSAWAAAGAEEDARIRAQDNLDAAKVRPVKARRLLRIMGEVDQARMAGLVTVPEYVQAMGVLEMLEARLVGTDAPKVNRHEFGLPGVHGPTADAVRHAANGVPPTPVRRTS